MYESFTIFSEFHVQKFRNIVQVSDVTDGLLNYFSFYKASYPPILAIFLLLVIINKNTSNGKISPETSRIFVSEVFQYLTK